MSPFLLVPRHAVVGAGAGAPSAKLNIAGIGVGGIGAANLRNLESENIVALCDVDPGYAAKTIARYPNARVWTDHREMLEQEKDFDAVMIATPDHTHAGIAMAAIQAGKHVFSRSRSATTSTKREPWPRPPPPRRWQPRWASRATAAKACA